MNIEIIIFLCLKDINRVYLSKIVQDLLSVSPLRRLSRPSANRRRITKAFDQSEPPKWLELPGEVLGSS